MPNVYVPTPYRDLTAGEGHVRASGATIGELIADLDRRYPGLAARICDGARVRHHVNVFVNGQEMRSLRHEATALNESDEVAFIPALVGGVRCQVSGVREGTGPSSPDTRHLTPDTSSRGACDRD